MITRERVFESLNNAVDENGYVEILNWDVCDIVEDLQDCDADCENVTDEELIPHVEAWLDSRGVKR